MPPGTSVIFAQQQLAEVMRQVDQISAEIAVREAFVVRLKSESDTVGKAQSAKVQENAEKAAVFLESQPKAGDSYQVNTQKARQFQILLSKVSDSIWDALPGVTEIWRSGARGEGAAGADSFIRKTGDEIQNAMWEMPALQYLEETRRSTYPDAGVSCCLIPVTTSRDLREHFNSKFFATVVSSMQETLKKEVGRHEIDLTALRQKLESLREKQKNLAEAIEEGQSQVDKKIIQWGLPVLGLLLLGILAIPIIYKEKDLQSVIFSSGIVLDMFTVFLLTVTILLLGLGHRLSENVLGTLLGGISGYVLGRSNRGGRSN